MPLIDSLHSWHGGGVTDVIPTLDNFNNLTLV